MRDARWSVLRIPILDRHVAARFLSNFVILFSLLFVFAVSVDVIVQADKYLEAANKLVDDGRSWSKPTAIVGLLLDFHGPRVFQFYQYMLGLVCIGAMGFTFSQMHRTRELVAVMAAGVSLRRVTAGVLGAALALNLFQIVNQEFILPRLAPRLVRDHTDLGRPGSQSFAVPLTRDLENNLLQAREFDPVSGEIDGLMVIERTEKGAGLRRVVADHARYNPGLGGWELENGAVIKRPADPTEADTTSRGDTGFLEPISFVRSSLHPQAIVVKRFRLYSQMLGLDQVALLAREGGVDRSMVTRLTLNRFAGPVANLLVLALSIPFFLLREPKLVLRQSVKAAAVSVPAMLGALLFLTVPFESLPAAFTVSLPIAVLLPVAAWRLAYLKT